MKHLDRLNNKERADNNLEVSGVLGTTVVERAVDISFNTFNELADTWQREHEVSMLPPYDNPKYRKRYGNSGRRESIIGWRDEGVRGALQYLSEMFPSKEFELISDDGSSAVVFGDENFAYKVMRTTDDYSYYEKEIAAMQKMHEQGIAPRPVALIDADRRFQRENPDDSFINAGFSDTPVPRINGTGKLPVIVMERVKSPVRLSDAPAGGLAELPSVLKKLIDSGVALGDCEPCYDKATGRILIMDCGGASDISHETDEEKTRLTQSTLNSMYTVDIGRPNPFNPGKDTIANWMNLFQYYVDNIHDKLAAPRRSGH